MLNVCVCERGRYLAGPYATSPVPLRINPAFHELLRHERDLISVNWAALPHGSHSPCRLLIGPHAVGRHDASPEQKYKPLRFKPLRLKESGSLSTNGNG